MTRCLVLISTLLLLIVGMPMFAMAQQDASPIPVLGPDGGPLATVTLSQVQDPFAQYDAGSPPDRGFHFVLIAVTVANTAPRPLNADPNSFIVFDADGFRYSPVVLRFA
ncbi:MAG: hypothetical protein ACR2OO_16595 [Thermomicrobiales bacterium]